MTLQTWLAFCLATTVILIIPGPTILTVIGYSLRHGKRSTVPLVVGVGLGDASALVLSLLGLGVLIAKSALAFTLIKLLGGAYLIYLGLSMFKQGSATHQMAESENIKTARAMLLDTWLITALNPKGIVFIIAFFPQFLNPVANVGAQLWVMSLTFLALAIINAALYAVFASSARRWVSSSRMSRVMQKGAGSLLIAAGVWTLTTRQ